MHFQTLLPAQTQGALHRPAATTGSTSGRTQIIRRLLLDPWMVAVSALAAIFLAMPEINWLGESTRSYVSDYFSTIVLLFIAVGAVLQGVRRIDIQRERYFWRLFGLSLSAWLAGEVLAFLVMDAEIATVGPGVDSLYLIMYLGLVLALDINPQSTDKDLRIRPLRILASAGRTLFVSCLFVYFVLLPRTLGMDEYLTWVPSQTFFVILDIYLLWRFIYSASRSRSPRWRLMFSMLTLAWAFVLITDALDFAWFTNHLPESFPTTADVFWFAPMILIVATSRIRLLTTGTEEPITADNGDDRIQAVPLLVYSLGFALLHLALNFFQDNDGALESARIALVMFCLVIFGFLHLVQNSIIERRTHELLLRRKEAEEHIRSLSLQDPLTKLLNRRAFDVEFSRAVARASRTGLPLGLMFIDLDHFKKVNDTYGHSAGDSVLREAAARIKTFTRDVDTLSRYGGDEFVLVLEGIESPSDATIVASRILDGFRLGFQFESGRIDMSASIGIAIFPGHGRTPSQLFEAADRAMYSVKDSGGSGFQLA